MKNVANVQIFRSRLRAKRIRGGFTQNELADKLDVSLSSVSHWESDGGIPSPSKLKKLAEELHCSIPYLLGDEEERESANVRLEPLPAHIRKVPVVSWAKAGDAHDFGDLCGQIDEMVDTECRDPNAFALIIEGDSMEPKFEAGYRVVFAPNNEPRNGDFVVARLNESHGVLFKRFRRTGKEGKTIRLESLNPAYSPVEYPASAFRFIYPAVEFRCSLPR